jgi:hypothetical protein
VLGGISQGSPDRIFGYELAPYFTWITIDSTSAVIPAGQSFPLRVSFDAGDLAVGDYYADILIFSNDPANPQLFVPAHLRVTEFNEIYFIPSEMIVYDSCGFHVDVGISCSEEIAGYQMDVVFPPGLVQLDSLVHGDFLGSGGGTYFTLGPDIDNQAGIVTFGAYLLGTEGAPSGSGHLAHLFFSQTSSVTLDTTLTIARLELLAPDMSALDVEVGQLALHLMDTQFGDFNGDERVTVTDILEVSTRWGSVVGDPTYDPVYDVDLIDPGNFCASAPDGDIDIVDVQLVASQWSGAGGLSMESFSIPDITVIALGFTGVGETGTIELAAENAVDLGAYEFVLRYDSSKLRLVGVENGDFLASTGNSSVLLGPKEHENSVRFGAFSFGSNPGASGTGLLAKVNLEVLECGQCELSVEKALLAGKSGTDADVSGEIENLLFLTCAVTDVADGGEKVAYALDRSIPNPFAGYTAIRFGLANPGRISLRIFSVDGRLVRTLVDEARPAGYYIERWDGLNDGGRPVPSGVYFYAVTAGDFKQSKKMLLLK